MKKQVSIIILNWNGWPETIECLQSLSRIAYLHYEVIVVDNGSEDDSVRKIRAWAKKEKINNLSLIENRKNYGFAKGNNLAIRQVLKKGKSDYLLLLNNDTVVDKDFLVELVKVAESEEKIGIVGSKIYYFPPRKKNLIQSCGAGIDLRTGKLVSYGDGQADSKQFEKTKEVDYVYGASMLVKRRVWEKVGLFDEKFFAIAEDADFCLRAKKAGFLTYVAPLSKVWHKSEVSMEKVPGFSAYYRTRNLIWLVKKHTSAAGFLRFFANFLVFQFPRNVRHSSPFLLRHYLRGLKDGVFG